MRLTTLLTVDLATFTPRKNTAHLYYLSSKALQPEIIHDIGLCQESREADNPITYIFIYVIHRADCAVIYRVINLTKKKFIRLNKKEIYKT